MKRQALIDLAAAGTVLLDGATGSNLRAAGMPVGVPPELWVLEHPQVLLALQRDYVAAGSRVLCAPTFSANRLYLERFGLEERLGELNAALVALSREAAGGRALVAGDVTTSGKVPDAAPDYTYADALALYREQIAALDAAGVDLIVVETMFSAAEAMAAVEAAGEVCALPVLCTLTVEADGSLFSGGTAAEAAAALEALGADAVGINCSVGPDQLEAVISSIRGAVGVPVAAKPNAGMPSILPDGQVAYSMGPEDFARHMGALRRAGASVLGGCCGTTPEHIRALRALLDR